MYKQLSLFSLLDDEFKPGDYINYNRCGKRLRYSDMKKMLGKKVIMDNSNAYVTLFVVILIEGINAAGQLICYDGTEQRMYISNKRFSEKYSPFTAYSIIE